MGFDVGEHHREAVCTSSLEPSVAVFTNYSQAHCFGLTVLFILL